MREDRTENIHSRNTLVIAFSYVAVRLWYTAFFHFAYSNTATCYATNRWRYSCASLRDSFGSICVAMISKLVGHTGDVARRADAGWGF